jgi:hypothetical protein
MQTSHHIPLESQEGHEEGHYGSFQKSLSAQSWELYIVHSQAPITPNFPSGSTRDIVGDYVQKEMLARHLSHYYSREMSTDGVRTGRCDQIIHRDLNKTLLQIKLTFIFQ